MNRAQLFFSSLLVVVALAGPAAPLQFTINIAPVIGNSGDRLFAVAHGTSSNFVAVGEHGRILAGNFIPNQIFIASSRWDSPDNIDNIQLESVAAGNAGFVVSGTNNFVYTSTDSLQWEFAGSIFPNRAVVPGLAFNGGRFVAVAAAPEIALNDNDPPLTDTWELASIPGVSFAESYRGVTPFGSDSFAACGVFGVIRFSDDGSSWRKVRGQVGQPNWLGIASDGSTRLVTVGAVNNNATRSIQVIDTGNGGTTWSAPIPTTFPPGPPLRGIVYTGSGFIAVGDGGAILTSDDGITWTDRPSGTTSDFLGVTFAQTGLLRGVGAIVGAGGTVILTGTNPPPPVSMGNQATCAGSVRELAVNVTNSAGIEVVTVDWYEQPFGGTALLSGSFTLTNVAQSDNVSRTNHFWAEARDLRTGFTSTDRTLVILTNIARPTALVATNAIICNGEPVELHATLTGVPPWTVTWTDGVTTNYDLADVSVISSSTTPGIAWTRYVVDAAHVFAPPTNTFLNQPTNYFSYGVAGVTDDYCTAQSGDITNNGIIMVNPRPGATVSGTPTICNGDTTTVEAVLTGIGPWSVVWSSNDFPSVTNVVAVPPANGPVTNSLVIQPFNPHLNASTNVAYTVTALFDRNCTANPGDLMGAAVVTVNPRPRAELWSFNTTDCNGVITYTLTNILQGLGPWTVRWNDGLVQTQNTAGGGPVILTRTVFPTNTEPNEATNNIYYLTLVSNANTCIGNQPGDITGAVTNTVHPRPTAALLSFNTTDCNELLVYTLTNVLQGLGPWTIQWNDGLVQTEDTPGPGPVVLTRTVNPTNTELDEPTNNIYYVTLVSNANTCVGNQPGDITGSVTNKVNPRPTSTLTSLDRTNCNDGSAYIIQATLTGFAPWIVTWSDGAISNVFASPAVRTVYPANTLANAPATSSYWIDTLYDTNCAASQPGDIKGTNRVTVNPRPTSTLISLDRTNCNNGSAYIIQAHLTGLGPWTVTWWDGAISNAVASPATRTVFPTNTLDNIATNFFYSVRTLSDTNCTADQPGDILGTNQVTVNPRPTAVVTGTTNICNGSTATIQAALTGIGPWSVTWASNGTVIATHVNVLSTPDILVVTPFDPNAPTNVTYTVTALSDTNCAANSGDITGSAVITVYPVSAAPPASLGDKTTCSNIFATLSVSVPAGFTADWYDSTGTTLLLPNSTNYTPPLQAVGTNTFRVAARFDTNIVSCVSVTTNVSLITEACPGVLTIMRSGPDDVRLEWYGNYFLERTPTLDIIPASWTSLTQGAGGFTNFWTNSIASPSNFFRLNSTN